MKILSVCTSDTSGGAARAAYRIHQGVRSLGVDSRMFVKYKTSNDDTVYALSEFTPNNPLYNALDWCAAKVKNKIQHYQWNQYPDRDTYFKSDLRGTRIHSALQKLDYDVLHLHWINNRFLDLDELERVHKPIVWTLHDSWPFCGVCHYFLECAGYQRQCGYCPQLKSNVPDDLSYQVWRHKAKIYKDLDLHIVTPSTWLADCVRQSSLLKDMEIRVIPNGLDTNLFRPLQSEELQNIVKHQESGEVRCILQNAIQKGAHKPILLYGAMNAANDRIKGFANLLAALKILDDQEFEAHLVVFGAESQELSMQFNHIEVTFVGYVKDAEVLIALYNCADVMVVPSYSEVFGQTASEAMACATPVVAFRCTGIQDVVKEDCGYLAAPFSPEDFAKGIRHCITDNPNNQLGEAARMSVVQRYAMEIIALQYKALYESLL